MELEQVNDIKTQIAEDKPVALTIGPTTTPRIKTQNLLQLYRNKNSSI